MGTCKVVHKQSGQPIEDDVDYFYDMSYDEEFCTFEDVNEFTPPLLQVRTAALCVSPWLCEFRSRPLVVSPSVSFILFVCSLPCWTLSAL